MPRCNRKRFTVPGKASFNITVANSSLSDIAQLKIGFMESSDPRKFSKMMQLATLKAARTMVAPVKRESPRRTGRLRGAVAARKAKFDTPASVVGVKAGKSRGDARGAWYRWFVISGHETRGQSKKSTTAGTVTWAQAAAVESAEKRAPKRRIAANPFVERATQKPEVRQAAMDTIVKTINDYLTDNIKPRSRRGVK
jgi:hypothetical protein